MSSLYDKDIVTFMSSLGFEFHDREYYKCFTKDEGTCELTYSGAVDLVALIQSQKLAHGEMVIGADVEPDFQWGEGYCSKCEFQPTDGSQDCRCLYDSELRAEQRERNK